MTLILQWFTLGVVATLAVLWFFVHSQRRKKARKLGVGYRVFVNAPGFEKSKDYVIVETTETHLYVSSDGLGLSGRWVPKKYVRPATKQDPYED